jgi:hypothetical protein
MSVASIAASLLFNPQSLQNSAQQFRSEFQQLGQDLQSGNLTAAQSDFSTLMSGQTSSASWLQSNSPIAQELNQLSQDLQAGNLSAAQQDYSTIQQDMQSAVQGHHGHHHHHGGGASSSSNDQNSISQLFAQLGQELQAGDLSTAQQTYATMQQEFQQFSQNGVFATQSTSGGTGLSLTA